MHLKWNYSPDWREQNAPNPAARVLCGSEGPVFRFFVAPNRERSGRIVVSPVCLMRDAG